MEKETDWLEFLDRILDGGFALDIRKTGSLTMFVKNQLGVANSYQTNLGKFELVLQKKIEAFAFNASEALARPEAYEKLISLSATFIIYNQVFVIKCASLFIQLSDFNRRLTDRSSEHAKQLLLKTSTAVLGFIENYKIIYEQLGLTNIYEQYPFINIISEKWKSIILTGNLIENSNIIIGLIYLGKWKSLIRTGKEAFFKANTDNLKLFESIMSDISRLDGKGFYNYHDFIQDCATYFKHFYQAVLRRSDFWSKKITPSISKIDDLQPEKELYYNWARDLENNNQLSGDELKSLVQQPRPNQDI